LNIAKYQSSREAAAASTSGIQAVKMALRGYKSGLRRFDAAIRKGKQEKEHGKFQNQAKGIVTGVILTCLSSIGPKPGFLKAG
jgi:hypothetical protein